MQLSLTLPLCQSGDREMTPLFSGQPAALVRHTSAADLVQALAEACPAAVACLCVKDRPWSAYTFTAQIGYALER